MGCGIRQRGSSKGLADGLNQTALWDGLKNGYLSTIGSDHSPAPSEKKELGWENIFRAPNGDPIPFGAPSIETLVPLIFSEGVIKREFPIWWMSFLSSAAASNISARLFSNLTEDSPYQDYVTAYYVSFTDDILWVVSAIALLQIVKTVSVNQSKLNFEIKYTEQGKYMR